MRKSSFWLRCVIVSILPSVVFADMGDTLNIPAVSMFLVFVSGTLAITLWAARRTRTASDFYAAGGKITGFQNALAIAGDYMSAASFLGLSG